MAMGERAAGPGEDGPGCNGRRTRRARTRDGAGSTTRRWSRHSWRTVLTQRSAKAFALGERTGVRMASMPIEANTASKLVVNLVSRSRMRNRNRRPASSRSEVKLRATWVTQAMAGLVVTPSRCTTRLSISMTKRT